MQLHASQPASTTFSAPAAFPLMRTLAVLSGAGLVLVAGASLLGPWLFSYPPGGVWASGAMAGIAFGAVLVGVLPVSLAAPGGLWPTMYAIFGAAGVRVAVCLVALAFMISLGEAPQGPAAVGLVLVYLPLMFLEMTLLGRFVRDTFAGPAQASTEVLA